MVILEFKGVKFLQNLYKATLIKGCHSKLSKFQFTSVGKHKIKS